uniref:Uncharacterized protein n=1 Tax=Arundo donax TaxID=35708 RepID=A0A0A9ACF1_ARUDO
MISEPDVSSSSPDGHN